MKNQDQLVKIVEHFRNSPLPITADLLKSYCDRMHFDVIVPSEYEDFLFSVEHDEKKNIVLSGLMAELVKVQITPELGTDKQKQAVLDNNYAIERNVLEVIKGAGVLFRENDIMLDSIQSTLTSIIIAIKNRAGNMCARQLQLIAQEALGAPELTLKAISEWKPKDENAKPEVGDVKPQTDAGTTADTVTPATDTTNGVDAGAAAGDTSVGATAEGGVETAATGDAGTVAPASTFLACPTDNTKWDSAEDAKNRAKPTVCPECGTEGVPTEAPTQAAA